MPLTPLEETVQLSINEVQVAGVDGIDSLDSVVEENCNSLQAGRSCAVQGAEPGPLITLTLEPAEPTIAPHGSTDGLPTPRSGVNDPEVPIDIDWQLLNEQRTQTTSLEEALPNLVSGLGLLSASVMDIRGDTQALVASIQQLVGAVSGLAMSMGALV
ncbi:hypothetical protein SKAU_G00281570 [Synaphobranchus kaupii]|uniref:Uncharacterized protein n=1 Tax=Synaphobranchus kaupii TaxID=118154 RepID=A0A9Q1EX71_SYNKA|nr:hypothetical protein SKAU_G00281570 [Synaphobranchus kaupii]